MTPGTLIRFHGGWNPSGEKCSICNFPCGFMMPGEIVGNYEAWSARLRCSVADPDLWEARLSNGAYAVGYAEQFEIRNVATVEEAVERGLMQQPTLELPNE